MAKAGVPPPYLLAIALVPHAGSPTMVFNHKGLPKLAWFAKKQIEQFVKGNISRVQQDAEPGHCCYNYELNEKICKFHINKFDAYSVHVITNSTYPEKIARMLTFEIYKKYDDNVEILAKFMAEYENPDGKDKVKIIRGEIEDTKKIMQKNMNAIVARGESIDVLQEKAGNLANDAIRFEGGAAKLNKCCIFM